MCFLIIEMPQCIPLRTKLSNHCAVFHKNRLINVLFTYFFNTWHRSYSMCVSELSLSYIDLAQIIIKGRNNSTIYK